MSVSFIWSITEIAWIILQRQRNTCTGTYSHRQSVFSLYMNWRRWWEDVMPDFSTPASCFSMLWKQWLKQFRRAVYDVSLWATSTSSSIWRRNHPTANRGTFCIHGNGCQPDKRRKRHKRYFTIIPNLSQSFIN